MSEAATPVDAPMQLATSVLLSSSSDTNATSTAAAATAATSTSVAVPASVPPSQPSTFIAPSTSISLHPLITSSAFFIQTNAVTGQMSTASSSSRRSSPPSVASNPSFAPATSLLTSATSAGVVRSAASASSLLPSSKVTSTSKRSGGQTIAASPGGGKTTGAATVTTDDAGKQKRAAEQAARRQGKKNRLAVAEQHIEEGRLLWEKLPEKDQFEERVTKIKAMLKASPADSSLAVVSEYERISAELLRLAKSGSGGDFASTVAGDVTSNRSRGRSKVKRGYVATHRRDIEGSPNEPIRLDIDESLAASDDDALVGIDAEELQSEAEQEVEEEEFEVDKEDPVAIVAASIRQSQLKKKVTSKLKNAKRREKDKVAARAARTVASDIAAISDQPFSTAAHGTRYNLLKQFYKQHNQLAKKFETLVSRQGEFRQMTGIGDVTNQQQNDEFSTLLAPPLDDLRRWNGTEFSWPHGETTHQHPDAVDDRLTTGRPLDVVLWWQRMERLEEAGNILMTVDLFYLATSMKLTAAQLCDAIGLYYASIHENNLYHLPQLSGVELASLLPMPTVTPSQCRVVRHPAPERHMEPESKKDATTTLHKVVTTEESNPLPLDTVLYTFQPQGFMHFIHWAVQREIATRLAQLRASGRATKSARLAEDEEDESYEQGEGEMEAGEQTSRKKSKRAAKAAATQRTAAIAASEEADAIAIKDLESPITSQRAVFFPATDADVDVFLLDKIMRAWRGIEFEGYKQYYATFGYISHFHHAGGWIWADGKLLTELNQTDQPAPSPYKALEVAPKKPALTNAEQVAALLDKQKSDVAAAKVTNAPSQAAHDHQQRILQHQAAIRPTVAIELERRQKRLAQLQEAPAGVSKEQMAEAQAQVNDLIQFPGYRPDIRLHLAGIREWYAPFVLDTNSEYNVGHRAHNMREYVSSHGPLTASDLQTLFGPHKVVTPSVPHLVHPESNPIWKQLFDLICAQVVSNSGHQIPRNIFGYGPPGGGKTRAAESVASVLGWKLIRVTSADIRNPNWGQAETNVQRLFHAIACYAPCIVLIDEANDILGTIIGENTEATLYDKKVQAQWQQLMEGRKTTGTNMWAGTFAIYLTNEPDTIADPIKARCATKINFSDEITNPITVVDYENATVELINHCNDPLTIEQAKEDKILKPFLDKLVTFHVRDWRLVDRAIKDGMKLAPEQVTTNELLSNVDEALASKLRSLPADLSPEAREEQSAQALKEVYKERALQRQAEEESKPDLHASIFVANKDIGNQIVEEMITRLEFYVKEELEDKTRQNFLQADSYARQQRAQTGGATSTATTVARRGKVASLSTSAKLITAPTVVTKPLLLAAPTSTALTTTQQQTVTAMQSKKVRFQAPVISQRVTPLTLIQTKELEKQKKRKLLLQLTKLLGPLASQYMRLAARYEALVLERMAHVNYDVTSQLMLTAKQYQAAGWSQQDMERDILRLERALRHSEAIDNEELVEDIARLLFAQQRLHHERMQQLVKLDETAVTTTSFTIDDLRIGSGQVGLLYQCVLDIQRSHVVGQGVLQRRLDRLLTTFHLRDTFFTRDHHNAASLLLLDEVVWARERSPELAARRRHTLLTVLKRLLHPDVRPLDEKLNRLQLAQLLESAVTGLHDSEIAEELIRNEAQWPLIGIVPQQMYITWNSNLVAVFNALRSSPLIVPQLFSTVAEAIIASVELKRKLVSHRNQQVSSERIQIEEITEEEAKEDADEKMLQREEKREESITIGQIRRLTMNLLPSVSPTKSPATEERGFTLADTEELDAAEAPPPSDPTLELHDVIRLDTPVIRDITDWFPTLLEAQKASQTQERSCFAVAHFCKVMPAALQHAFSVAARDGNIQVVEAIIQLTCNIPETVTATSLEEDNASASQASNMTASGPVPMDIDVGMANVSSVAESTVKSHGIQLVESLLRFEEDGMPLFLDLCRSGGMSRASLDSIIQCYKQYIPAELASFKDDTYASGVMIWWSDATTKVRCITGAEDAQMVQQCIQLNIPISGVYEPSYHSMLATECHTRSPIGIAAETGRVGLAQAIALARPEAASERDEDGFLPIDLLFYYHHPSVRTLSKALTEVVVYEVTPEPGDESDAESQAEEKKDEVTRMEDISSEKITEVATVTGTVEQLQATTSTTQTKADVTASSLQPVPSPLKLVTDLEAAELLQHRNKTPLLKILEKRAHAYPTRFTGGLMYDANNCWINATYTVIGLVLIQDLHAPTGEDGNTTLFDQLLATQRLPPYLLLTSVDPDAAGLSEDQRKEATKLSLCFKQMLQFLRMERVDRAEAEEANLRLAGMIKNLLKEHEDKLRFIYDQRAEAERASLDEERQNKLAAEVTRLKTTFGVTDDYAKELVKMYGTPTPLQQRKYPALSASLNVARGATWDPLEALMEILQYQAGLNSLLATAADVMTIHMRTRRICMGPVKGAQPNVVSPHDEACNRERAARLATLPENKRMPVDEEHPCNATNVTTTAERSLGMPLVDAGIALEAATGAISIANRFAINFGDAVQENSKCTECQIRMGGSIRSQFVNKHDIVSPSPQILCVQLQVPYLQSGRSAFGWLPGYAEIPAYWEIPITDPVTNATHMEAYVLRAVTYVSDIRTNNTHYKLLARSSDPAVDAIHRWEGYNGSHRPILVREAERRANLFGPTYQYGAYGQPTAAYYMRIGAGEVNSVTAQRCATQEQLDVIATAELRERSKKPLQAAPQHAVAMQVKQQMVQATAVTKATTQSVLLPVASHPDKSAKTSYDVTPGSKPAPITAPQYSSESLPDTNEWTTHDMQRVMEGVRLHPGVGGHTGMFYALLHHLLYRNNWHPMLQAYARSYILMVEDSSLQSCKPCVDMLTSLNLSIYTVTQAREKDASFRLYRPLYAPSLAPTTSMDIQPVVKSTTGTAGMNESECQVTVTSSLLELKLPVPDATSQEKMKQLAIKRLEMSERTASLLPLAEVLMCNICKDVISAAGPHEECGECLRLHKSHPGIYPRYRVCPHCATTHSEMHWNVNALIAEHKNQVALGNREYTWGDAAEWSINNNCVTIGTAHDITRTEHGYLKPMNYKPLEKKYKSREAGATWLVGAKCKWKPVETRPSPSDPTKLIGDRIATKQMLIYSDWLIAKAREHKANKRARSPSFVDVADQADKQARQGVVASTDVKKEVEDSGAMQKTPRAPYTQLLDIMSGKEGLFTFSTGRVTYKLSVSQMKQQLVAHSSPDEAGGNNRMVVTKVALPHYIEVAIRFIPPGISQEVASGSSKQPHVRTQADATVLVGFHTLLVQYVARYAKKLYDNNANITGVVNTADVVTILSSKGVTRYWKEFCADPVHSKYTQPNPDIYTHPQSQTYLNETMSDMKYLISAICAWNLHRLAGTDWLTTKCDIPIPLTEAIVHQLVPFPREDTIPMLQVNDAMLLLQLEAAATQPLESCVQKIQEAFNLGHEVAWRNIDALDAWVKHELGEWYAKYQPKVQIQKRTKSADPPVFLEPLIFIRVVGYHLTETGVIDVANIMKLRIKIGANTTLQRLYDCIRVHHRNRQGKAIRLVFKPELSEAAAAASAMSNLRMLPPSESATARAKSLSDIELQNDIVLTLQVNTQGTTWE